MDEAQTDISQLSTFLINKYILQMKCCTMWEICEFF